MDAVKLDQRMFNRWNDCHQNLIFSDLLKRKYHSLSKADQEIFDPEQFIQEQTEKIFLTYDYILVTPNNKVFGQRNDDIELIIEGLAGAYECAMKVK
jgi:hypothetical protein